MQTFDQALFDLYENGSISYEDALRNADSVNDLRLQIKLNSQRSRNTDLSAGTEHMSIVGLTPEALGDAPSAATHDRPATGLTYGA
jgi:hypothetical protein